MQVFLPLDKIFKLVTVINWENGGEGDRSLYPKNPLQINYG